MRQKKGFTLIELLVVIAIIAMLLSIIMPGLKKAKLQAQSLLCKNNVRELSRGLFLYTQDFNNKTMPLVHTAASYWFHQIAPYLGDKYYQQTDGASVSQAMKVSYCPVAAKPHPLGGWGNAQYAWSYQKTTGSYGLNLWLLPEGSGYDDWGMKAALKMENVFPNYTQAKPRTPSVGDCNWVGSWPDSTDRVPSDLKEGNINHAAGEFMGRFCIDRHNKTINIGFVDGHSEQIPLERLWTLSWHKDFAPNTVTIP